MMRKCLLAASGLLALAASGAVHSAMAADMQLKAPATPVVAPMSWTGFYGGIEGGAGWTPSSGTLVTTAVNPGGAATTPYNFSSAVGPAGGGLIGANYQFNMWVVGIEADWQYMGNNNLTGNSGALGAAPFLVTTSVKDLGAVRGRLGFTFLDFLLYATGGWAWTDHSTSYAIDVTGAVPFATNSVSSSGYTVGTGMDYALTHNFIMRGEYRYTNLGTSSFVNGPAGASELGNKVVLNEILYGLIWKFDAGPVVARY